VADVVSMTKRIRRSLLYVPAQEPEKMVKALDSAADGVIFDLETSVPDDEKVTARENVGSVLAEESFENGEVCVRINGVRTDLWLEDLMASVEAGADTIRVPMIDAPWDLRTVTQITRQLGADDVEFLFQLETPRGIFDGREIAEACKHLPEVTGISIGGGDYAVAVGASELHSPLRDYVRNKILGYAYIGEMDPLASIYMDVTDEEGLRAFAERAAELGFIGMSAISPSQVPVINDVFTPGDDEVEEAREKVEAYDEADSDAVMVDGEFLEDPVVDTYRSLIERYEEIQG
jgi:citrate lyase subunit beta/citryl-CoA lyase